MCAGAAAGAALLVDERYRTAAGHELEADGIGLAVFIARTAGDAVEGEARALDIGDHAPAGRFGHAQGAVRTCLGASFAECANGIAVIEDWVAIAALADDAGGACRDACAAPIACRCERWF